MTTQEYAYSCMVVFLSPLEDVTQNLLFYKSLSEVLFCGMPPFYIRSNNSSGFIAGTLLSMKSLILRVTIKSTFIRCAHTI